MLRVKRIMSPLCNFTLIRFSTLGWSRTIRTKGLSFLSLPFDYKSFLSETRELNPTPNDPKSLVQPLHLTRFIVYKGSRRDSNSQLQASQACVLPLNYDHHILCLLKDSHLRSLSASALQADVIDCSTKGA